MKRDHKRLLNNKFVSRSILVLLGTIGTSYVLSGCSQCERPEEAATAPSTATATKPSEPAAPVYPGTRRDITNLTGVNASGAAGDLDGDQSPEWVFAGGEELRVVKPDGVTVATMPTPAGIQVLEVVDLDEDGRNEIVAGWGMTQRRPEGTCRVTRHILQDGKLIEELILAPETERPEVAAIFPLATGKQPQLFVAYYESKYFVRGVQVNYRKGRWELGKTVGTWRSAGSFAYGAVRDAAKRELIVGRVYGDAMGTDGDAFIWTDAGEKVTIPTTRGIRALTLIDTDKDGVAEIFFGDGWHKNYGEMARGLLSRSRWDGKGFQTELIEDIAGQFTVWKVYPIDLEGDGQWELVAHASTLVRLYRRQESAWKGLSVSGEVNDVVVGNFDDKPGDELLLLGKRSEFVSVNF